MRDVLCNWTPRNKYFKYQDFSTFFRLSLFLECFVETWRKSVKFVYPINWLKVVVFLPESNKRLNLIKALKQIAPHQEVETWNRKPMEHRDLRTSMTMDQDLDRLVKHWGGRHSNEQSCQRQTHNPRQKWKNWKMFCGARQRTDRQLSKSQFEAIFNVLVSRLVHAWRKGNLIFNFSLASFGLTATSLIEILTPAWGLTFIWNTFFSISRVLLKISDIFFLETLGWMFEFSLVKLKKKVLLKASDGGK